MIGRRELPTLGRHWPVLMKIDRIAMVISLGGASPSQFHPPMERSNVGAGGVLCPPAAFLGAGKAFADFRSQVSEHVSTRSEATRFCERAAVANSSWCRSGVEISGLLKNYPPWFQDV